MICYNYSSLFFNDILEEKQSLMQIKKSPIRENRYLNIKVGTYPMEFNLIESVFHDLGKPNFCTILNDGEKEVVVGFSTGKVEALEKHKELYDRLLLRSTQWFDVKNKKFKYVLYNETPEGLLDVTTIDDKNLYSAFVFEAQSLVVTGANHSLTYYTKREATEYSRKVIFSIFSGLRVKVGKLKNTSYQALNTWDGKAVETFVNQCTFDMADKFLKSMYTQGIEHDKWEMFVDLLEAKISEYYKDGNRNTVDVPNFISLEEIVKEVEDRAAINNKANDKAGAGDGGGKADWSKRNATNKAGKFYVDDKCISCDACAISAPKFFKLNEQHAYIFAQPTTPEDIDACNKALTGCPVAAIGSDGDVMSAGSNEVKEAPKTQPKVEETKKEVVAVVQETKTEEVKVDLTKEIEEVKAMFDSVPAEKIAELKALVKSMVPEVQTKETAVVIEPVAEVKVETTQTTEAKALPQKSPDGANVYPENVAGMFYVDDKCISCDACPGTAPDFFVIQDGHAYVFAQPKNDKEIELCKEAMSGCPVGSININA